MVKISISELKEFLKRSRPIKPNPLMPVLGYLLLDCVGDKASLTKTNLHSYCRHEIDAEFEQNVTLLIDEKMLSALISNTDSDTITITPGEKIIVLSDGRSDVSFSREQHDVFPPFPNSVADSEPFDLPADVLYSIRAAISIINTSVDNQFSYCFISPAGDKYDVFSTHTAFTFYRKQFETPMPAMTISPETGAVITMYESIRCYTSGNFSFFDCGKTVYGFVLSEYKAPPYQKILAQCKNEKYFEINRADLLQFCELILSSSPAQVPTASINDNALAGVTFSHADDGFKVSAKMDFAVEKNFTVDRFDFNPKLLVPLLKTMDSETIRFSPMSATGASYAIWSAEDTGLLTLLSGIVIK